MEHSFGPYLEMARIQSEMNKLFDVLLEMRDEEGDESSVHQWIPSVDVIQTSEGLVVRCELPGVPAAKLKVTALGGALIVTGERPSHQPEGDVKFHCMERLSGRFRRVIPLGMPINTRDATAALKAGVLEVFFPKVPNRRGEEVVIPVTNLEASQ
ncbi:MAG TPA: Hsp20/alpha crystallin family protein [Patescibacteria group bacterium]|nr:Hsp20/alpha crystallin family protein [Patescibacteria group bacterium]